MTNLVRTSLALFVFGAVVTAVSGCAPPSDGVATPPIEDEVEVELPRIPHPGEFGLASHTYELTGPLVPRTTTMVTAWDLPQNPLTDATLDTREDGELIRHGFRLFTDTPGETPRYTPGGMTCANCHLNSGQRELALPLVGSAGMFPEYNGRAGRTFSLEDRIVGCFYRSQNSVHGLDNGGLEAALPGAATTPSSVDASNPAHDEPMLPDEDSVEVLALAAYLRYLSEGYTPGEDPPWRRKNRIPQENRIAVGDLNPQRGEEIYEESCANCHGPDGQGVHVGDKKPGPLWGPDSWNDGAGFTRFYQLAGFVRFAMPYMDPGALGDADAQHVAAFIISKPRPAYPYKDEDYQVEPLPIDAPFYRLGDDADRSGGGRQPQ